MRLSLKIAPGVRIRTGRRGVRTSIGPRVARLHVGGGYQAGMSTGVGPVTAYAPVKGSTRRKRRSQRASTDAAPARPLSKRSVLIGLGVTAFIVLALASTTHSSQPASSSHVAVPQEHTSTTAPHLAAAPGSTRPKAPQSMSPMTTPPPPTTSPTTDPPPPMPVATPAPVAAASSAWCQATVVPANDGYAGDFNVNVTSDQPYQQATASDAGDTHSYETNAAGDVVIYLWHTVADERVTVSVGGATCSALAQ